MVKNGCYYPFKKKGETLLIPCGKCLLCRKRLISQWSHRLMEQHKDSDTSMFITLTYNDSNLPFSKNRGWPTLHKKHLQNFFKRLRRHHDRSRKNMSINSRGRLCVNKSIKYYAVGEYGGERKRPHYHLLLFNCKQELIQKSWTNPLTGKHIGHVNYGDHRGFTAAAAGYCLMYIGKPDWIGKPKWDDRQKEFSLMSKGLGKSYLTPEMIQWHRQDLNNRMYVNVGDGKKASMPRYYKLKLYSESERELALDYQLTEQLNKLLKYHLTTTVKQQKKDIHAFQQNKIDSHRKMKRQLKTQEL